MDNQEFENLFKELTKNGLKPDFIHASDLPNIDLYMDQLTTFMESGLKNSKRYNDDKILTKTMINNYAKNHLIPAPEKKKYSKDHLILLIFIYYFKNFLSINDISSLLTPLTERYFHTDQELDLGKIYEAITHVEEEHLDLIYQDILDKYKDATERFLDISDSDCEEDPYLQIFTLICTLSFDVYLKKQLIENLIDHFDFSSPDKKKNSIKPDSSSKH